MKKIMKMAGFMLLAASMLLPMASEASAANILMPGQTVSAGQMLTSADGRFAFVMQTDGNLVHYNAGTSLWDSDTRGDYYRWTDPITGYTMTRRAEKLAFDFGRIRVTDVVSDLTFWQSNNQAWIDSYYRIPMVWPTTNQGSKLIVQDDGNVVLYNVEGRPVWATNTGGR